MSYDVIKCKLCPPTTTVNAAPAVATPVLPGHRIRGKPQPSRPSGIPEPCRRPCPIDDELQLLRGTSLHAVTAQWKAQVDSDFSELEELQLPSPSEGGCSTARDVLAGFLTKEGYLWALGTVRVVPPGKKQGASRG